MKFKIIKPFGNNAGAGLVEAAEKVLEGLYLYIGC